MRPSNLQELLQDPSFVRSLKVKDTNGLAVRLMRILPPPEKNGVIVAVPPDTGHFEKAIIDTCLALKPGADKALCQQSTGQCLASFSSSGGKLILDPNRASGFSFNLSSHLGDYCR